MSFVIHLNEGPILTGLILVATPIGNLGDMTVRGLETLHGCDLIACEDTRVSAKLLRHYGIKTKMIPYHDHNADKQLPGLLKHLRSGKSVALISDAGMPLISDPGYRLVNACAGDNIPITAAPGASAVLTGLALSCLPTDKFLFLGFMPRKKGEMERLLQTYGSLEVTLIFFEAPTRLRKTLETLAPLLTGREVVIAREITKRYEEVVRGPCKDVLKKLKDPVKGEIVLLIGPAKPAIADPEKVAKDLKTALKKMSLKDAVQTVSHMHNLPRKDVYQQALHLKK